MNEKTLQLLIAALAVKGDDKRKKVLPYFKMAAEELQEEINRLEERDD